jgi:hypothetical protein
VDFGVDDERREGRSHVVQVEELGQLFGQNDFATTKSLDEPRDVGKAVATAVKQSDLASDLLDAVIGGNLQREEEEE